MGAISWLLLAAEWGLHLQACWLLCPYNLLPDGHHASTDLSHFLPSGPLRGSKPRTCSEGAPSQILPPCRI
jgi:hypothetical protein